MYQFRDFYLRKPWWHYRRWQATIGTAVLLIFLLLCVKLVGRRSDDMADDPESDSHSAVAQQTYDLDWDATADHDAFDPMRYSDQSNGGTRKVAPRTHFPPRKELVVSGANDPELFRVEEDLVEYHDTTIWWESDHDGDWDTENDHLVHRDILPALIRLNALVLQEGATLKIQDAYREEGIHAPASLHREGRALDLTADGMSLARLAQLAVQAGFDWVYYESPKGGGAHIHASVARKTHMGQPVNP